MTRSSGAEHRSGPGGDDAPLAARRAFVVQLRGGTEPTPHWFVGRVEHVSTGQAATFQSIDDLLAFIGRVLSQPDEPGHC
jgi:hypothetical protein